MSPSFPVSRLSGISSCSGICTLCVAEAEGPDVVTWLESERVRIRFLSFPDFVLCERQVRLCASKLRDLSNVAWQPMQVYTMKIISQKIGQKCIEVPLSPRLRMEFGAKIFFMYYRPAINMSGDRSALTRLTDSFHCILSLS